MRIQSGLCRYNVRLSVVLCMIFSAQNYILFKISAYGLIVVKCRKLRPWRAFLKRPENVSGPEDFSGLFSGEFLGARKAFLNAPENTPDSHPSFSGCFLGFAARAWQWFVKNLNWHGCTELGSSRTLQIKPSFVESQANFWLFLSFVQFQHHLLYFDWSLLRM